MRKSSGLPSVVFPLTGILIFSTYVFSGLKFPENSADDYLSGSLLFYKILIRKCYGK